MEAVASDAATQILGRASAGGFTRDRRDYLVGICILLVVVFLWTASNFVTQDLFEGGYDKPFWITYISTASFTLYLFPYMLRRAFGTAKLEEGGYQPLRTEGPLEELPQPTPDPPVHGEAPPPLTTRETANLAGWFCFLWFIANWSLNAALGYTSVASATILSSMSGFFTLAIGRIFRVESLTLVKIGAVATSFGGVVLVSLSDNSSDSEGKDAPGNAFAPARIVGDILALLSAFFYATYMTLLKVRIREESRIDMQLFFGFVGLFNVLFLWPMGVLLHFARIERFELPVSSRVVVALLISMGITLSSDYLYVLAMLKTTPLVVTIGLSLTMPLAVVGDFILHKPSTLQVILGAAIVLLSFVAVGLEDSRNSGEKDLISGKPLDEERVVAGDESEEEVNIESHALSS
ncbi:uncharacterized protein PHACADRAFT_258606 [Phanerochaete carnosa HHB-10118-sp]|uniref:Uncharacterized protein n=1 Tax=Phanerochaete carnosa (strain HHB-10118-sp) TaxID=650164 RepID=K5UX13_PHACS|nr:uncharacterized protein PHACADRAFT_258606 [Phanerochaete carnosa HHB-10118-sp]EKM54626.1 hypothetical protein PHACADRAFT_258606 [Phanerochaete carnosa HHB-10118-sp]